MKHNVIAVDNTTSHCYQMGSNENNFQGRKKKEREDMKRIFQKMHPFIFIYLY